MDYSSEEESCLMKAHFLNPCVTSIDGPVAKLPPRHRQSFSVSSTELDVLSSKISESGFRFANPDFISWALKMETLHASTWKKAGIFEAIKASLHRIPSNPSLILALVEKWCPETKSFIFPWGEATITLEDVMVLLDFSVLGSSVFAPLESSEMRDSVEILEKGRVENMATDGRVAPQSWVSSFRSRDDQIGHDAFLAMWLSQFVFPNGWRRTILRDVFPIAVRLARGEKIALAPAVLASLYRDLDRICAFARDKSTPKIKLVSLLKLVQVWIWERFRNIRPEALKIQHGEPRIAQWGFGRKRFEKNESFSFDDIEWRPYCRPLENWNPPRFYLEEAKWMTVDDSLDDEFVSFARCLRVSRLVGIGFVEDYYPHRVARQFGLAQDLPGVVTDNRNFTEKEAWDDYNKPLDGLKLYVTSRPATTPVTARYQEWWLKSISEFLSSEESHKTFNASNAIDGDGDDAPLAKRKGYKKCRTTKNLRSNIKQGERGDCGGSASREVPLSEMFHKALVKSTNEHSGSKRAREYDDEGSMDFSDNSTIAEIIKSRKKAGGNAEKIGNYVGPASKEVPLSELFEKELAKGAGENLRNITIAEMIKSRKKTGGDASESIKKGNRLEENNNDSGIPQNLASGDDETVAQKEIVQRSEENGEEEIRSKAGKRTGLVPMTENNSSDPPLDPNRVIAETIVSPPEKRQNCDVELVVNESNAEKKAMIDDGAEGLLHGNVEKLCGETKKEDDDEKWKQRKLAIEELGLNLEARMVKIQKTLAMIRKWKTRRNQFHTGVCT